jgi:hypothetical protein
MPDLKDKIVRSKPSSESIRQSIAEQMAAAVNHPGSRVAEVFEAIHALTQRPEKPVPLHQITPIGFPHTLPSDILANAAAYRKTL